MHELDSARDLNCAPPYSSTLNSDDSNAIVLAEKKKNRKKDNKQVETNKTPKLSKSQKKKLQKIQEEKEKALRFAKSIKTLEKYKLQEDAHSLMWSSRRMGQAESVREKRLREVQYAKAGIEVPDAVRPFKKRCSGKVSCEIEADSDEIHPMDELDKNNLLQPVATERRVPGDANRKDSLLPVVNKRDMLSDAIIFVRSSQESVCGGVLVDAGDNNLSDNDNSMQRDAQNVMPSSSGSSQKRYSWCDLYKTPETSISRLSNVGDCPAQRVPITPMVVHVSRPKEVESKRKDLPIVMMEQEIMEAINEKISVIICGETGCGKTTQVPQFLYEAGFGSGQCSAPSGIIGVTQPRRVAVLATAKRVAFELGLRLGKEVGFQVRHDKKIGDGCSIKFMTDGILLRELQSDLLLKRYSVIILDEAHERSLNTDILIGFLSRIIRERQRFYEEQQQKILSGERISPENKISPLKLVLMSATLRVEDFISGTRLFRETPPVINVPTRQYPVTIHFSKKTETVDYIGQAYKKVMSIHKKLPPGGILVFVTGQREVEYLCQKLCKASREMVKSSHAEKSGEYVNLDGNCDIKEINEAFEMEENSSQQQTDRFSSYDRDDGELFENESDFSSDSGTDSDLEYCSDDADVLNQKAPKVDGNLEDVLGEDGSLALLRAAFNALAGKNELNPDSDGKQTALPLVDGSVQSIPSLREKRGGETACCGGAMRVLPLYAMLPASSQLRVFEEVEGERLVVVATNVAETSLTIPGIKYVVDTGREKVKIYNSSNGMESYEVQWISKASAAQRAGRAGRTGPGHCYRVYSSAVFNNVFPDFSTAEISKVPVDGVVLLMKSMGIDKVANFPFPTPPEPSSLVEAERTLRVLNALNSSGKLTPLGKSMARYPMSPRHSRMLLTVIQNLKNAKDYARANIVLAYTIAAAAALSLPNPFVMQFEGSNAGMDGLKEDEKSVAKDGEKVLDKEEKMRRKRVNETAKASRVKYLNPTSDALTIANALQAFELSGSPGEFCNNNALHLKTMEEMSKLRKQLIQLVFNQSFSDSQQDLSWTDGTMEEVENAWRVSCSNPPLLLNEEEVLGKAICAGWADRVAKRTRGVSGLSVGERKVTSVRYQACMVKETVFLHRWSSISRSAPEYLIYTELLHTKRPYIHGATSVKSDWLVKYASSLCTFSAPLTDPRPYYEPVTDQVLCWVVPTFGPHLWQLPLHSLPIKDDAHRVVVFAFSWLQGQVLPCLRSVQKFMAASPAILLRPEALAQRRVGALLNKLKARRKTIDSCAKLRETWNENPRELYSEIKEWFQEVFYDKFDALWAKMLHEVLLHPSERFPKKS